MCRSKYPLIIVLMPFHNAILFICSRIRAIRLHLFSRYITLVQCLIKRICSFEWYIIFTQLNYMFSNELYHWSNRHAIESICTLDVFVLPTLLQSGTILMLKENDNIFKVRNKVRQQTDPNFKNGQKHWPSNSKNLKCEHTSQVRESRYNIAIICFH